MFLQSHLAEDGERVSFIGQFVRTDGNNVVLQHANKEVLVEHKGLDSYKSKNLLVSGTIYNGVLLEEFVYPVDDDFNFAAYSRLAAVSTKYAGTLF